MDQDNDDLSNWMMKCYEEKKTSVLIPRNMQMMNFIISGFSGFTFKTSILRNQMKNITIIVKLLGAKHKKVQST